VKSQRFDLVFRQWMDCDVPVGTVLFNFSRKQENGLLGQTAIMEIEINLPHHSTVTDCAGMICELAYRERSWS